MASCLYVLGCVLLIIGIMVGVNGAFLVLVGFVSLAFVCFALANILDTQKKMLEKLEAVGKGNVTTCKYCHTEYRGEGISCPHCGRLS